MSASHGRVQNSQYIGTMTAVSKCQLRVTCTASDTTLTKVHEATNDVLDTCEERDDVTSRNRRSRPLVRSGPCNDKFLFFSAQPAGIGWKVGDQEVSTDTDADCRYTFEDENPPPTTVAADILHVGDSTGK